MIWLRRTLALAVLAAIAVLIVRFAEPWLTVPEIAPAAATE
ncbi:hypothetical protein [Sinisalibacter aestuarii]|nr:hypothetical protein [Sinisalibacter aestuarii]